MDIIDNESNLTRKRKREPNMWNQNIRKKKRQSGKEYVDSKGNIQPSRKVKLH